MVKQAGGIPLEDGQCVAPLREAAAARRLETADAEHALRIADRIDVGSTVYADGRFYQCLDRVRMGGGGMEDVLLLARVRIPGCAEGPERLLISSVAELDAIERKGRAAIVTPGEPRAEPPCIPQPSPAPSDRRAGAALAMA